MLRSGSGDEDDGCLAWDARIQVAQARQQALLVMSVVTEGDNGVQNEVAEGDFARLGEVAK